MYKRQLKDRILALAGTDGTVVLARIGEFDFNDKHEWKEHKDINLQTFLDTLKHATLLHEINGRPITTKTVLDAVGDLNAKAVTFFQEHFYDKIVNFQACDFRLDTKKDRSQRVAVCHDRRLSLQHAGQDIPALMLDAEDVKPLDLSEFFDILVTLASFYNFTAIKPTKSQKPVYRLLDAELPAKRAQIAKNMKRIEDQMAHLNM